LALERVDIQESTAANDSALLIGRRGGQYAVHSLRVAELGETFVFDPALARGNAREDEESARARSFPVLRAEK
ncbi:MAG: hypothetical protein KGL75_10125, partial [Acidobacteriota bacterium]|nr:hypothetical protein [Acidobacteriota bacterium]